MALAMFDLDDTLIDGSSDEVWEDYLIERNFLDAETCYRRRQYFHYHYYRGTLDIHERQRAFLQSLKQFSLDAIQTDIECFVMQRLRHLVKPGSQALIAQHRAAGDDLLIVSAASSLIAQPIADFLEIPSLLATEPEIIDGHVTGEISGVACFREGKVSRLEEWMLFYQKTLDDSFFYADSINDLALLEFVHCPVAVDPDEELAKIATTRNWPVISLKS